MADINFDCPYCGHNLDVNERGAGLSVACPECSKSIEIPIPAPKPLISDFMFNCGSCGRPLKASENMIGQLVDCPSCKKTVEVTLLPSASAPQPSTPITPPQPLDQAATPIQGQNPQVHAGHAIVEVKRRSLWSSFWNIIGALCLAIGFFGFIILLNKSPDPESGRTFIFLIGALVAGLQAFFFAFLIDVFTDIRWLLTVIYNKD